MTALLLPIGIVLAFCAGAAYRVFERTDNGRAVGACLFLVWLGVALFLIGVGGLFGLDP